MLKALDHPNIIHLADVFETETRIYMVSLSRSTRVDWTKLCVCVGLIDLPKRFFLTIGQRPPWGV